jgi:molecular chaperone GrpE
MTEETSRDWHKVKETYDEADEVTASMDSEEDITRPSGALESPDYKALEEKLTLAEQQAHENWEKSVRAMAELDNVRRRSERDVEQAHRFGLEKMITGLLPVIDSLEQSVQLAEPEGHESLLEGLKLTTKLFLDALSKFQVTQVNPLGEAFDPQTHEAMAMVDAPDSAPNTVMTVFQKGYLLSGRVIRPARVIVSKPKSVDEKV